MNVLFTIAVLAVLALWALAIYNRLQRLRRLIWSEWKQLDAREKAGAAPAGWAGLRLIGGDPR